MKVYLAGGMYSGWQDFVTTTAPENEYFDPRSSGLTGEADYTRWDLEHVAMADVVFAYMEADNPGGEGAALEVGYAKCLGKVVVLVEEEPSRYGGMMRACANYQPRTLEEGVETLKALGVREWD